MKHNGLVIFFLTLAIVNCCIPAYADDQTSNLFQDTLAGDWGGGRADLLHRGLMIEGSYTANFWRNIDGGADTENVFLDNTVVSVTAEGEKLYGISGSTVFLSILKNTGGEINGRHVGSHGGIDNMEVSKSTTKLYEAWIEQRFMDEKLSIRAGLYDLNSEFYVTESSGLFLNPTYGIGTEMASSGENGPSIFPATSLGVRILGQIASDYYIQTALFDGVPGDIDQPKGTRIAFEDGDGALIVAETGYKNADHGLIGFGVWGYTSSFDHFTEIEADGSPAQELARGAYVIAEALLSDDISTFARIGTANGDVNAFDWAWAAGAVWNNPFALREEGTLGLALSGTHNSNAYKDAIIATGSATETYETQIELTYRDQILSWLGVQPDVQYTFNPGTGPSLDNALTAGLRVEISF